MNDIFREFVIETHENVAQLDLDLISLERSPNDREAIARVFRVLHTIKGTAGFLGFAKLQSISHAAESVLARVRAGELPFEPPLPNLLLQVVDAIRELLSSLETTRSEGNADLSALVSALESCAEARESSMRSGEFASASHPVVLWEGEESDSPLDAPTLQISSDTPLGFLEPTLVNPSPPEAQLPEPSVTLQTKPSTGDPILPPRTTAQPNEPTPRSSTEGSRVLESRPKAAVASESSVRVDVELLDRLMNLVGELVLTRNQILQHTSDVSHPALTIASQRLNQITSELQSEAMKTRMQPIGSLFTKFPRMVRDLSAACGKKVRLVLEGHETELDKSILDSIRDPLTHLLRNAIDHGIETPTERLAAGKDPEGLLHLRASHRGGKVSIELEDDGRGIDPQRLRDKALRMGWLTTDQAREATDRELLELIFKPGFSTTDKVTQFSGRGVGMDVVRTNVEAIRGSVSLDSRPQIGTLVRLQIPLTIAILPALIVEAYGERFAIAQVFLRELLRADSSQQDSSVIESIHGARVLRLRQEVIPLIELSELLGLPSRATPEGIIVVLEAEGKRLALLVDAVHDSSEIVIKSLQPQLRELEVYAGATILGDGTTTLILDIPGLMRRALQATDSDSGPVNLQRGESATVSVDSSGPPLLVVSAGEHQWAIEMNDIDRLEIFSQSDLAQGSSSGVIPYRDEILPLVSLAATVQASDSSETSPKHAAMEGLSVVVHRRRNHAIGFWVDRILDIRGDVTLRNQIESRDAAIRYSAVIEGRAVDCMDLSVLASRWERRLQEQPS